MAQDVTPRALNPPQGAALDPPGGPRPVTGVTRNGALAHAPDFVAFTAACPGCGADSEWIGNREGEPALKHYVVCDCDQDVRRARRTA